MSLRIPWSILHRHVTGRLRAKIVMWFFVPTAIILAGVALVNFFAYQEVTEDLVLERDQDLTRLSAGQLSATLGGFTDLLSDLARAAPITDGGPAARQDALGKAASGLLVFDGGVVILDTLGVVVASEPIRWEIAGESWSDREYYAKMLRSSIAGGPGEVFSDIVADGPDDSDVIVAVVPITSDRGEFRGSMLGMFRLSATGLSAFYGEIVKLRLGGKGTAYLVDGAGRVLYHPGADRVGTDVSGQPVVQRVLAGETGAMRTEGLDDIGIVAGFAPVPGTSWGFVKEESWNSLTKEGRGFQRRLMLMLVLGALAPVVFVVFGLRHLIRPLEELVGAAREVASGRFGRTLPVRSRDEIGELTREFNSMSAQLQESYAHLEDRVAVRTRELSQLHGELQREVEDVNVLVAIGRIINSSLDIEEVYEPFAQNVARVIPFEWLHLTEVEQGLGRARHVFMEGQEFAGRGRGEWWPLEGTFTESVIAGRTGVMVGGETPESLRERFPLLAPVIDGGARSFLSVPLIARDEVIGALQMGTTEEDAYTSRHLALVERVGNQIARAVENARLFQENRELGVLEERNRVAREIHDTLAQGFTGIVLQLEAAEQALQESPEEVPGHLERAKGLARGSLQEARRSVWDMVPQTLEQRSLDNALAETVREFAETGPEEATFTVDGERRFLQPSVETALLRICQESLTNLRKHAKASRARVKLRFEPRLVRLTVTDNGMGFDATAPRGRDRDGGFGLIGMEQRARLLQGSLSVNSGEGQGTTVEVTVPTGEARGSVQAQAGRAGMETIRLLIVDDHMVVRDGLTAMLQREPDLSVVGEARDGREAVQKARELSPDVILMDLRMPELDGVGAMREIRAEAPDTNFLVLTTFDTDDLIFEALDVGAKGYLLKDTSREELFRAVRAVHRGESLIDPSVAAKVLSRLSELSHHPTQPDVLSERELEVLQLMAKGSGNKEIAASLFITESTIKTHVANIFQKLDVNRRTEAVTQALQRGIIKL